MTYATEFPAFPADAIPALPWWQDRSWQNEPCPCFEYEPTGLFLWIAQPDPMQRDELDAPRYCLKMATTRDPDAGWQFDGDMIDLEAGDDWQAIIRAITAATIAREYSALVRAEFDAHTMAAIIAQNRAWRAAGEANICAVHDYCDANMLVAEAFEKVTGRDILPDDGEPTDADCSVWNLATTIADCAEFFPPSDDGADPCPINRRPKSTCPDGCNHGED